MLKIEIMTIYIYYYENIANGKGYVGQTNDMERRHYEHVKDSKIAKDGFDRAIYKYGETGFNLYIIGEEDTAEKANAAEIFWIAERRKVLGKRNVYNQTDGGFGRRGSVVSEETRKKISATHLMSKEMELGIVQAYKDNISLSDIYEQFEIGMTGIYNALKRNGIDRTRKTRPRSDETKKKISEGNKDLELEKNVINAYITGDSLNDICRIFNVGTSLIYHILNRKNIPRTRCIFKKDGS